MNSGRRHPRAEDYLKHIQEAASLACDYVSSLSREDFLADRKTQQAVIYNILIIGEAATKIITQHPEFTENHPEIPWREMRGIRNRMAHGYYELDLDIIWETVKTQLGKLGEQIAAIK